MFFGALLCLCRTDAGGVGGVTVTLGRDIQGERSVETVMVAPPSEVLQDAKAVDLVCVQFCLVEWQELETHCVLDPRLASLE